jgi:cardiolipin synthase (CMP-forming)
MGITLANKITIGRILSVPFFIWAVLSYSSRLDYFRYIALAIFLFSTVSDAIDGYVARRWRQKTRAGAILDPLADKTLLISAFVSLYNIGPVFPAFQFPLWLVLGVISRDLILITGSAVLFLVNGEPDIEPTFLGRTTIFFQVLCVVGMLTQFKFSEILWQITVALSIVSLTQYLYQGIKKLNNGGTT